MTARTSVVIPTIGRPRQLGEALASLARCAPAADEIVVVTQTDDPEVAAVVARHAAAGARLEVCLGRSIGQALNAGLRAAVHPVVFVTNDDCTVAEDWIGVGLRELGEGTGAIVTGAVLPVGDPDAVPSLRDDPEPEDYQGVLAVEHVYGANMVVLREELLAFGAFDDRVRPSAEDNDLCYRWLAAGRVIRYRPALRIWHHDWRTPAQMRAMYRAYGRGQGMFLAKHLAAGDRRVLPFLARDVKDATWELADAVRHARRPDPWAVGWLQGLPGGLLRGRWTFRRDRR